MTETKCLFLDYMKSLRQQAANPEPDSALLDGPEPTNYEIKITALGYPILPNAIMKKELSKVHCEKLLQIYLSQYYCACISLSGQPILTRSRSCEWQKVKESTFLGFNRGFWYISDTRIHITEYHYQGSKEYA